MGFAALAGTASAVALYAVIGWLDRQPVRFWSGRIRGKQIDFV